MKRLPVSLGVALLAVSVFADPIIVKQRALGLRDQNNVRQGIAQPTQPATTPATPVTPASPTPVQLSVAALRKDLVAIKANTAATADQKQKITQDLIGVAHGANKPSQATAASLANSLAAAFAEKPLADKDCSRLLSDLAAVCNPATIPASRMQAVYDDIQAIFQVNGMSRKDALRIVDQVKAIAAETQKR
jgi:hypothetical protein